MSNAIRKTISLPRELAAEAEEIARAEGKTLSVVVAEALVVARARRLTSEFEVLQKRWSARAAAKGVLTERDLDRLLRK